MMYYFRGGSMGKVVVVGSKVTVEVYLGEVKIDYGARRKYLHYGKVFRVATFLIERNSPNNNFGEHLHPSSFSGRALVGRKVGDDVEVNVGGLSVEEARVGQTTGNHLKYVIVAIE